MPGRRRHRGAGHPAGRGRRRGVDAALRRAPRAGCARRRRRPATPGAPCRPRSRRARRPVRWPARSSTATAGARSSPAARADGPPVMTAPVAPAPRRRRPPSTRRRAALVAAARRCCAPWPRCCWPARASAAPDRPGRADGAGRAGRPRSTATVDISVGDGSPSTSVTLILAITVLSWRRRCCCWHLVHQDPRRAGADPQRAGPAVVAAEPGAHRDRAVPDPVRHGPGLQRHQRRRRPALHGRHDDAPRRPTTPASCRCGASCWTTPARTSSS